MASPTNSPLVPNGAPTLLALPPEVLGTIIQEAFQDQIVNISPDVPRNPGLLLACRQLYASGKDLYYKHSIFIGSGFDVKFFLDALKSNGTGARHEITKLRCDFTRNLSGSNFDRLVMAGVSCHSKQLCLLVQVGRMTKDLADLMHDGGYGISASALRGGATCGGVVVSDMTPQGYICGFHHGCSREEHENRKAKRRLAWNSD